MSVRVGTSGWSYPSWRPGFYPPGTDPAAFLSFYAAANPLADFTGNGRIDVADYLAFLAAYAHGC